MFRLGLVLILFTASGGAESFRVGNVDFFGTAGIDVEKIRSALPIRVGDQISEAQSSDMRRRISAAVERTIGHSATNVQFVCCNAQQELTIFVGLGGSNSEEIPLTPAPQGSACLPAQALTVYREAITAVGQAIRAGKSGEDDSRGFSLSDEPAARAKQMAMHAYAMTHEQALEHALKACRSTEQRQAAAEMLGYAEISTAQINALALASRDPDEVVRNNAVRALWVLATSSPKTASEIPADKFVEMLNSGIWTDRNKAGKLLAALTVQHNPKLLNRLLKSALPSLIEMARWSDSNHADDYGVLLGRIAGFDEPRIGDLIREGRVREIISAVDSKKKDVRPGGVPPQ